MLNVIIQNLLTVLVAAKANYMAWAVTVLSPFFAKTNPSIDKLLGLYMVLMSLSSEVLFYGT